MKRNKMLVVGVLAATSLLVPTGLRAQEDHCSRGQRENCLLGSFLAEVAVTGRPTFRALITFIPGGGVIETNLAQGPPVTVHGNWKATEDGTFALTFITLPVTGGLNMAKTRETVTPSNSGDSFTAVFQSDFFDPTGHIFLTVRGTLKASRISIEPLAGSGEPSKED